MDALIHVNWRIRETAQPLFFGSRYMYVLLLDLEFTHRHVGAHLFNLLKIYVTGNHLISRGNGCLQLRYSLNNESEVGSKFNQPISETIDWPTQIQHRHK